jgi:hypothetical protein
MPRSRPTCCRRLGRADGADGSHQRYPAPGVLNVVSGFGVEAGKPLAQNKRINNS